MFKPNVIYQINGADLIILVKELISIAKEQAEEEFIKKKSERYLSTAEVSKMLSVDLSTLWRWNKNGYLTHKKIGTKNRYLESDIQRLIND